MLLRWSHVVRRAARLSASRLFALNGLRKVCKVCEVILSRGGFPWARHHKAHTPLLTKQFPSERALRRSCRSSTAFPYEFTVNRHRFWAQFRNVYHSTTATLIHLHLNGSRRIAPRISLQEYPTESLQEYAFPANRALQYGTLLSALCATVTVQSFCHSNCSVW